MFLTFPIPRQTEMMIMIAGVWYANWVLGDPPRVRRPTIVPEIIPGIQDEVVIYSIEDHESPEEVIEELACVAKQ